MEKTAVQHPHHHKIKKLLPIILALIYTALVLIISLYAFFQQYSLASFGTFLLHLIPTLILVAITKVAWKHELTGGISFILLGLIITVFFRTYENVAGFFIVSMPLAIIGLLFLIFPLMKLKKT